jgi:hypothetical protein
MAVALLGTLSSAWHYYSGDLIELAFSLVFPMSKWEDATSPQLPQGKP